MVLGKCISGIISGLKTKNKFDLFNTYKPNKTDIIVKFKNITLIS